MKAAEADPLWAAIHRRNGRLGVFCNTTPDGRRASFFAITKQRGEWYQHDLGEAEGDDPFLTVLHGSHSYAGTDGELIALHHRYLERLADDIVLDGRSVVRKLEAAADAFL